MPTQRPASRARPRSSPTRSVTAAWPSPKRSAGPWAWPRLRRPSSPSTSRPNAPTSSSRRRAVTWRRTCTWSSSTTATRCCTSRCSLTTSRNCSPSSTTRRPGARSSTTPTSTGAPRGVFLSIDRPDDIEALLNDPLYLGNRHARGRGQAYDDFIARYPEAVSSLSRTRCCISRISVPATRAGSCQTTRGHDMRRSERSAGHKQPYSLPEVTSGFRFGFPFGAPGTGLGARARGCPQAAAVRLITCSSPRSEARPGGWS